MIQVINTTKKRVTLKIILWKDCTKMEKLISDTNNNFFAHKFGFCIEEIQIENSL